MGPADSQVWEHEGGKTAVSADTRLRRVGTACDSAHVQLTGRFDHVAGAGVCLQISTLTSLY